MYLYVYLYMYKNNHKQYMKMEKMWDVKLGGVEWRKCG